MAVQYDIVLQLKHSILNNIVIYNILLKNTYELIF